MKKVWNIGKLILAMLLLAQAVRWNQRVRSVSEIISVYMEKEGVAVNKAREICSQEAEREDPCSVCFWKETKDASGIRIESTRCAVHLRAERKS